MIGCSEAKLEDIIAFHLLVSINKRYNVIMYRIHTVVITSKISLFYFSVIYYVPIYWVRHMVKMYRHVVIARV